MHGHDRPCAGHPGETRADRLGHRLVELVGYDAADVVRLEDLCQITHRDQASRTTATCAPTCVNRLTRRGPVQPPRGTKPEPTGNTGQSGGPSPGTAPRAPAKTGEGQRAGSAASAGVRGASPGTALRAPAKPAKDSEQDPPPRLGVTVIRCPSDPSGARGGDRDGPPRCPGRPVRPAGPGRRPP